MTILNDIKSLITKKQVVIHLAWSAIRVRYARSILGPFWIVLTSAISVAGLGYVWSTIFNQDRATFIPMLTVGLVLWIFLSSLIVEASNCYIIFSNAVKNTLNPIILYPVALLIQHFIVFVHTWVIIIGVFLIYPPHFTLHTLMIIPNFLLVMLNLLWITITLAILGARYRDLNQAIASLMTILFFLSPVLYKPDALGLKSFILWFNPFSYFITAMRYPLEGAPTPLFIYYALCIALIIGFLLVSYLLRRTRYRIVYWL